MKNSKLEVLTPENSQVIFIDQQPQMAFGVQSMDRQTQEQYHPVGQGREALWYTDHDNNGRKQKFLGLQLSRAVECVPGQTNSGTYFDELMG